MPARGVGQREAPRDDLAGGHGDHATTVELSLAPAAGNVAFPECGDETHSFADGCQAGEVTAIVAGEL